VSMSAKISQANSPNGAVVRDANRKLRLMQITHDLAIGGLQQVVLTLCKTIDRRRFEIDVLCLRALGEFAPEIEQLGIPVTLLPQKPQGTDYLSFLKVARILRDRQIDVIHTHNTQPLLDGGIGALLAGVPTIVHTDHGRQFPDKRRYMFAEWLLSHCVYRVVGVSDRTSKNLIDFERISPRRIVTIRNGIVGETYQRSFETLAKRRELGIPDSASIIGLGARLTEEKGISFLLHAISAMLGKQPNLLLVVAGDGPLRRRLEDEAQQLGVASHVRFIGTRTDMPELMRLFDIFVLPSISEGLPMVLLEALAAGRPVVATNVGGISEVVRDGHNGFLVPSRDSAALASSLSRLLNDRDLVEGFGRNSRAMFESGLSAEHMARSYEQLYLREAKT
jgi:glycosyltransferase involved in cell wall biosynthesis